MIWQDASARTEVVQSFRNISETAVKLTECHLDSNVVQRVCRIAARSIVVGVNHLVVGCTPTKDTNIVAARKEAVSVTSSWIRVVYEDGATD